MKDKINIIKDYLKEINKNIITKTLDGYDNIFYFYHTSIDRLKKINNISNTDIILPNDSIVAYEIDYNKNTFWVNYELIYNKLYELTNDYDDKLINEILMENYKTIGKLKINSHNIKISYEYLINSMKDFKENNYQRIRKVYDVLINDEIYEMYCLPNRKHEGYNDTNESYWLYYDSKPSSYIPDENSKMFVPEDISINRHIYDIRFTQTNTSKIKWDDIIFSNRTKCSILCNNKLIYEFYSQGSSNGLSFTMNKSQYLLTILSEHPFNFHNPEEEEGRKIFWYGLPAKIKLGYSRKWEIQIVPDYTDIDKEKWWKEYKNRKTNICDKKSQDYADDYEDEYDYADDINWGDVLSDQHINWFRD